MVQPLLAILICLVFAYLFSELFKLIRLPRVVGQIFAGLILGYALAKYAIFDQESLKTLSFLANLGIILLFYYVGLETNFKSFVKNFKKSVWISVINTFLPLVMGYSLMHFVFRLDNLPSLIIGASLSVSAQSVSIDILEELKILKTRVGNMIISAGAVDDIIELLIVTIILSSFHFLASRLALGTLIFDVSVFIAFVIVARLWFIPYTLKFFGREKSTTSRFMASMIIVLLIAYFSELLGIGTLIGAMIAGMIVRQTIFREVTIPNWEEHDIAKSTHIIAFGFLIPLFFIWVGLNTDVRVIPQNFLLIGLFVLIALIGTIGGTVVAILLNRGSLREGLLIGWGLTPKGDVELVIIAVALKSGIITQPIFTALVVMSLITTIISSVVFKHLAIKYDARHL